jgi:hypothetical protein
MQAVSNNELVSNVSISLTGREWKVREIMTASGMSYDEVVAEISDYFEEYGLVQRLVNHWATILLDRALEALEDEQSNTSI